MKQIALSVDQMKHLKELGLNTSDASMYNYFDIMEEYYDTLPVDAKTYPKMGKSYAYTLQDILEKLPKSIGNRTNSLIINNEYTCYKGYDIGGYNCPKCIYGNPLDTAYQMLCYCIENKYIEV